MPLSLPELSRFQQCMVGQGLPQATLDLVSECLQRSMDPPGVNVPAARSFVTSARGLAVTAKAAAAGLGVDAILDHLILEIDSALANLMEG